MNSTSPAEEPNIPVDLAESLPQQANTPMWAYRCKKLILRQTPKRVHLPDKDRLLTMLPHGLTKALCSLTRGEAPWPLFLHGPPGVGKTCIGLLLLDFAGGFYHTASTLAEDVILAGKGQLYYEGSHHAVSQKALWKAFRETALVVLDEVGSRSKVADWHYECTKRLLDEREVRPLVVISNLDLDQIAQVYDDRVASRLAAGTVLACQGEDLRLKR